MDEKKYVPPGVDYEPYLLKELQDPEYAAGFLNEALAEYIFEGDINSFNSAIKYVLKSHNISQLSKETGVSKQHIHRIISGTSKPTFDLLTRLFKSLGYQFELKPIKKTA